MTDRKPETRVKPLHAYLITLKPPQSAAVQAISNRLTSLGYRVVVVEGIRGAELTAQDFFRLTNPFRARTGKLMTPGELGCLMSHEKALRLAASVGQGRHLILEDDFIASDTALNWIAQVQDQVTQGTLLHLGGQEHMGRFYRYVRGEPITSLPEVANVYTEDLRYLMCTVAYMVDSRTATALAELMAREPYLADDFGHVFRQGAIKRIWFRWVVSHPTDATTSTIAADRLLLNETTKRHWSYRSRMNWARLWRRLVTRPALFLKNQQSTNQLPI
jgi:glycosyl transferase family 25